MGSVGNSVTISEGHISENSFMEEASRQGINGTNLQLDLEEYVTSSYGGNNLANRITKFIEEAPRNMMYNKGTLYRGLYFNSKQELDNFINSHKPGDTLNTRTDGLSWTASKDIAKEFSSNSSDYSVVLVNNDTNRIAMGIKNIADTPISSEEVLYSNRVNFTVSKVEKRNGVTYIHVKQKRSKK
jgi:hypothetical protein